MHSSSDDDDARGLGVTALLSALLVAFTIEFDNAFEERMPHRTTRHGSTAGPGPRPWLVSMPMWVHCMRLVPAEGISAGELARRSQLTPKTTQEVVKRLSQWWRYLQVSPGPADRGAGPNAKPQASQWLVRPTPAGQQAQRIWAPLTEEVERRWDDRFGRDAVDELRSALAEIVAAQGVDLPDYLALGEPRRPTRTAAKSDAKPSGKSDAQPEADVPLTALLSKVLLGLALDFDDHCDLSVGVYTSAAGTRLPICANVLRLLGDDDDPVAVADIPARSGVDKMSIDNWIGSLDTFGYLEVATATAGRRRRVARLRPEGIRARDAYLQWTQSLPGRWPKAGSAAALARLTHAAEEIGGDPGPGSAMWQGMEPHPDGWRAQVAPRQALPHFPVVSHRGGFPDGS